MRRHTLITPGNLCTPASAFAGVDLPEHTQWRWCVHSPGGSLEEPLGDAHNSTLPAQSAQAHLVSSVPTAAPTLVRTASQ